MKDIRQTPQDFSDIEGLMLAPQDPEIPRHYFHGTPAIVCRFSDDTLYGVNSLYYDGDRKGFCVTVTTDSGPIQLFPGQFRTYASFVLDEETGELNTQILD